MLETPDGHVRKGASVGELRGASKELSAEPEMKKELVRDVEQKKLKLVHLN